MTSRPLVDPELLPFLDAMPTVDINAANLTEVRANRQAMLALNPPPTDTVTIQEIFTPARKDAPPVRMKIYAKKNGAAKRPAILHLHGGGYIMGSPEMMTPFCAQWADTFDAVIVAPAYRLGPETSYPGNVEDAYAALVWLHGHASAYGIDTSRIAVMGESAGGGLAAALALLVRDRAEYKFCYQHLIFPMLDDRTALRKDISKNFGEFVWTNASNHFGWSSLLGKAPGGKDVSPYAAAARAETLKGLPPTFLATGALDLFTEENLDYAKRLMADGIPTELHVYPGAPHAFMAMQNARITAQYARDAMSALARGLGA